MPSQQCRLNAERCSRLAERARRPATRQNFAALADTWAKLAAQLESDEALLNALLKLEVSERIDALPLALSLRAWPPLSNDAGRSSHQDERIRQTTALIGSFNIRRWG
jgi:hypothetical protein